jgi:hypothetical protein
MPAWVDTAEEEKAWKTAKEKVREQRDKTEDEFSDRDWGLVTHIAQQILKSSKGEIMYRPQTVQESRVLLRAGLDEEYDAFFQKKLKEYGAEDPGDLSDEDKKKFFNEIELEWEESKGPTEEEQVEASVRAANPALQKSVKADLYENSTSEASESVNESDSDSDGPDGDYSTDDMAMDQRMYAVAEIASSIKLPVSARLAIEEAAEAVSALKKGDDPVHFERSSVLQAGPELSLDQRIARKKKATTELLKVLVNLDDMSRDPRGYDGPPTHDEIKRALKRLLQLAEQGAFPVVSELKAQTVFKLHHNPKDLLRLAGDPESIT